MFRLGIQGSWQYGVFNNKYQEEYSVDKKFNNLNVISFGGYVAIAFLNIGIFKYYYSMV